jgi:hypothetical protein
MVQALFYDICVPSLPVVLKILPKLCPQLPDDTADTHLVTIFNREVDDSVWFRSVQPVSIAGYTP